MSFITIFLTVVYLLHYYMFFRLVRLWHAKHRWWWHVVVNVVAFSYLYTSLLYKEYPSGLTLVLLRCAGMWLGVGLVLLMVLAACDVVKLFAKLVYSGVLPSKRNRLKTRRLDRIELRVVIAITLIYSLYAFLNARGLDVKNVDIPAPVTAKIVQLSDIHLGSCTVGRLRNIVNRTNSLNPDMVVITGDMVDSADAFNDDAIAALNELNAPAWFVSGNHEQYAGITRVLEKLNRTKITPLENTWADVDAIRLVGVSFSRDGVHLENTLKRLPPDDTKYRILLCHNPEGIDTARKYGVKLFLAGHTHNGQIFPFNYVIRLRHKYIRGMYDFGGMRLWVSPGTGTWGPAMRSGSRNTITCLNLAPQK